MAIKFTDRSIRDLEIKPSEYAVREADGFAVRVRPSGRKIFQFLYDFNGKRVRLGLGDYPTTPLPAARAKFREARNLLAEGRNPATVWAESAQIEEAERARELDRIAEEAEAREAAGRRVTVADFVKVYVDQYAKPRKKTWAEDERLLQREVVQAIGNRKLDEIKRADVVALMESIKARLRAKVEAGGRRDITGVLANRVCAVLSKMFAYALEIGHVEHNPAISIRSAKVRETSSERALSMDEVKWVWSTLSGDLQGLPFGRDVADVLLMMLATGQRKAEILALRYDAIDADGVARWAGKMMKNGRPHSIPLPQLAMQIIERRKLSARGEFVFPGLRRGAKTMGAQTPNHATWDWFTGRHETVTVPPMAEWTPHDLRRTVATQLATMAVSRVVIDRILAHVDGSIAGVYDRHSYMTEMRNALESWNERIRSAVTGQEAAKVIAVNFKSA